MFFSLLRLILFFLSQLGCWEFLRRKTALDSHLMPLLAIGGEFCVLYLGGLLNFLPETGMFLYFSGLLSLLYFLYKDRFRWIRNYISWGYLFLLLSLGLLFLAVRNKILVDHDDFSHWGIVVKNMLETGRFPNFTDEVVSFQNYPLGSSAWLWYFCTWVGNEENRMLMGQGFIMLCSFLPWFSCIRKDAGQGIFCLVFSLLAANFLLCYNNVITILLVDTLLPLTGMASLLFLYQAYIRDPEKRVSLWYGAMLLIWVAQIKNSGLLFALLGSVLMLLYPSGRNAKALCGKLAAAASPALGFLLWSRHCKLVFANSEASKHTLSINNYSQIMGEKTPEEVHQILEGTVRYILERREHLPLLIWLVVLGLLVLLLKRDMGKSYLRFAGAFFVTGLLYCAGTCGMYLFSMPTEEAIVLASIVRYMKTMDIALVYLLISFSLLFLAGLEKPVPSRACAAVLISLVLFCSLFLFDTFPSVFAPQNTSVRLRFQNALSDYGVPYGSEVFIASDSVNYENYYFICRYDLGTSPLSVHLTDPEQLEAIGDYHILINLDPDNPIIQDWIARNYPDRIHDTVIYMY